MGLGNLVLLALVILRGGVFLYSVGERFLAVRLAVVAERIIDVERQRAGQSGQAGENRFGLADLLSGQAGDGGADTRLALGALHFEHLTLGVRLSTSAEILADALAVEPTGDAENDFPRGIREWSDDERSGLVHDRFAT